MTKCDNCGTWIDAPHGWYQHQCVYGNVEQPQLQAMRAKVAEHKELQADPDYQLAKAAFTVLAVLAPKVPEPAWIRATAFLMSVSDKAFNNAYYDTKHLTPRRRWQDKEAAK